MLVQSISFPLKNSVSCCVHLIMSFRTIGTITGYGFMARDTGHGIFERNFFRPTSLLPLFCLSTQSCSLAALICYCYLQIATFSVHGGPCNHHRGISTLVLFILYRYTVLSGSIFCKHVAFKKPLKW